MKRKARRPSDAHLAPEDRVLWHKVARTVTPLSRAARSAEDDAEWQDWLAGAFPEQAVQTGRAALLSAAAGPAPSPPAARPEDMAPVRAPGRKPVPGRPLGPVPLEDPAWKKLARGRVPIDASIDLHHLNQDEAFSRLHGFLVQARARGCRHVLVITGKGSAPTSDGVLRRMLPVWVATMPFSHLVGALRPAGRGHGGDGAFYLRLRKADDRRLPGKGRPGGQP